MTINLKEVESLLQLAFSDFCDFGASELEKERYIAEWRSKIGYCKKHLTSNLTDKEKEYKKLVLDKKPPKPPKVGK